MTTLTKMGERQSSRVVNGVVSNAQMGGCFQSEFWGRRPLCPLRIIKRQTRAAPVAELKTE